MRIAIWVGGLIAAASLHVTPSPAVAGGWCLSIEDVDCSIPSYGACRLAALPEGGDCYPNARHRWRPRHHAALMYAPRPVVYGFEPSYGFDHGWGWYPHRRHRHWDAWHHGTPGHWCLTIELTDCSQPSFEMCRFAALPEGGDCYPNPYYRRHWRSYERTAQMRRDQPRTRAVAARTTGAPVAAKVDSTDRGLDGAPDAVAAPAGDGRTLGDVLARVKAGDDAPAAFAMADPSAVAKVAPAGAPATEDPAPAVISAPGGGLLQEVVARPKPTADRRAGLRADVPTINVAASCRTAANALGADQDYLQQCLNSERGARDQLVAEWPQFAPAERASCTQLTTMSGGGTYTSLFTCLDLKRFARSLPKGDEAMRVAGR